MATFKPQRKTENGMADVEFPMSAIAGLPFTRIGSDTLTNDGTTGGKLVVADVVYKVSDIVPTEEDFANGSTLELAGYGQTSVTLDTSNVGINVLSAYGTPFAYIVYSPNAVINDVGFPETGIYYDYNLMGGVTSYLTINGFGGFDVVDVLNIKSLPKHSHNNEMVTTTGTGSAYEATLPGITSLKAGISFVMIPHVQSTNTQPTLNVNGFGAKRIYRRGSDSASYHGGYSNGWLRSGQAYNLMYSGSYWIVTDSVKPTADDIDGRIPVANGGVPSVGVSNNGKVLTIENDVPTWKEPSGGSSTDGGATISDLTNTTWLLNETIDDTGYRIIYVDFISNGTNYTKFRLTYNDSQSYCTIKYDDETVYTSTNGWLDEKYRSITYRGGYAVTDEGWIGWNETYGRCLGNSLEMPQIRFVSAKYADAEKIVSENHPLKLTVEIVGGGALQVGDRLQICARRTYGYKDMYSNSYRKQKLRCQQQYEITAEDLNRRFLTITTDGSVDRWLFKNDRKQSSAYFDCSSAFYMRIKRVTQYAGGKECDAIFSNIVTVWKTFNKETKVVNLK